MRLLMRPAAAAMVVAVATGAVAVAALNGTPPPVPPALEAMPGAGGGYRRVVGDASACPARLQFAAEKTVMHEGALAFMRGEQEAVEMYAPGDAGEERGRCAWAVLHGVPDVGEGEEVSSQISTGKIYWDTTDARCVPARSPPQSRITVVTRAALEGIKDAAQVPGVDIGAVTGLLGKESGRMMFYRNSEVAGGLKNCVYVDGGGEVAEITDGAQRLFRLAGVKNVRPAMEMIVQALLFGPDGKGRAGGKAGGRAVGRSGAGDESHPGDEGDGADLDAPASGLEDGDTGVMQMNAAGPDGPLETREAGSRAESAANCFPGHATAEREDGSLVRMDALTVGDCVKVGPGEYSRVFLFTHKLAAAEGEFVTLHTASGAALALTGGHFVYANGALVPASDVTVGDELMLGTGGTSAVVTVGAATAAGLFNPQTENGDIVVSGVLASTYTTAVRPTLAHVALAPLRSLYRVFGAWTSALDGGADRVARRLPAGMLGN